LSYKPVTILLGEPFVVKAESLDVRVGSYALLARGGLGLGHYERGERLDQFVSLGGAVAEQRGERELTTKVLQKCTVVLFRERREARREARRRGEVGRKASRQLSFSPSKRFPYSNCDRIQAAQMYCHAHEWIC
jgi:hypothetical protein